MPARILIVEDDGPTLELLSELMKARGHHVWTVADGNAAVAAAVTNVPDLVICDINLPVFDGHEVLKRLREAANTTDIPVVAITAPAAATSQAMQGVRERMLALGFTGYIPKPIEPKIFAMQVEAYLKR